MTGEAKPDVYGEALLLANGNVELVARGALNALKNALAELDELKVHHDAALAEMRALKFRLSEMKPRRRGAPSKRGLKVPKEYRQPKQPGRPAKRKTLLTPAQIRITAEARQRRQGGTFISNIRGVLGDLVSKYGEDLTPGEIRVMAQNISKHRTAEESASGNDISALIAYMSRPYR